MKPYSAGKRYCTTGNYQNLLRSKYNWWLYISKKKRISCNCIFISISILFYFHSRLKNSRIFFIGHMYMHGCMTNRTKFSIHLVIAHLSIYLTTSELAVLLIMSLCTIPICQNSRVDFMIAWITHAHCTSFPHTSPLVCVTNIILF